LLTRVSYDGHPVHLSCRSPIPRTLRMNINRIAAPLAFMVTLLPAVTNAQTPTSPPQDPPTFQDTVQVTATRFGEIVAEVPGLISVISGDEIRARGATDLRTALALLGGVSVASGGDAGPAGAVPGLLGVREVDDLLLLIAERVEASHRTERSVILQTRVAALRQVISGLEIRRKRYALRDARPVERPVQRGVKCEIPFPKLLIDDGPDFHGPGVLRELLALVPDFHRQTDANGPLPFLGHADSRPDVIADPLPADTRICAGEDEPSSNQSLKPWVISSVSCNWCSVGYWPSTTVLLPSKVKLV